MPRIFENSSAQLNEQLKNKFKKMKRNNMLLFVNLKEKMKTMVGKGCEREGKGKR